MSEQHICVHNKLPDESCLFRQHRQLGNYSAIFLRLTTLDQEQSNAPPPAQVSDTFSLSWTSSELCFRKRSNLLQLLSERNRNELRILAPFVDIHCSFLYPKPSSATRLTQIQR